MILLLAYYFDKPMRNWLLKKKNRDAVPAGAKSLQSCPTLGDPIDRSPLGSSVPGILQARTLEWVAISFSNAWKWKVKVKSLSHARLLATPWTAAHQAPLSMGLSKQEDWGGVPSPFPKAGIAVNISRLCRLDITSESYWSNNPIMVIKLILKSSVEGRIQSGK